MAKSDGAFEIDSQLGQLELITDRVRFLSKTLMFADKQLIQDYTYEDLNGLSDILCHIACDLGEVHKALSPFADFKEKEVHDEGITSRP